MRLRLLADDLTGALDTAACFVSRTGPIAVHWAGAIPDALPASAALDTGTREASRAEAVAITHAAASALVDAEVSYKKIDSLLRGHPMAELAACLTGGRFDHCVVAPAFPHHGRVTRGGIHHRLDHDGNWHRVGDILGRLAEAGVAARLADSREPLGTGVSVFDAESDADLARIVRTGLAAQGPVLWCGSAGLALALAQPGCTPAEPAPTNDHLAGPVLGLFGSDQPATAAQLAACGPLWVQLPDGGSDSAARLSTALVRDGAALASLALPGGLSRASAAARIGEELGKLAGKLPAPGTLLVAGGETLRALCMALGANALDVIGQIEPGLPVSRMRGGRWDSLRVVSKSGAFGGPNLWRDIVAPHVLSTETINA